MKPENWIHKTNVQTIVEKLMEAKDAYYNGNPIMSDQDFDNLEDQLIVLDPENFYFSVVGASIKGKAKVRHEIPMLSCNKVKDLESLYDWLKKIGAENEKLVVEPKIDGLSCSITYVDGKLTRIATRGDGHIGQDITHIAKHAKDIGIPSVTSIRRLGSDNKMEVRGELYLPKNTKFPNPENKPLRSLANGLVNRKDSGLEDVKYIRFVSYQLLGTTEELEHNKLLLLEPIGFDVIEASVAKKEKLSEYFERYLTDRKSVV